MSIHGDTLTITLPSVVLGIAAIAIIVFVAWIALSLWVLDWFNKH